MKNKIIPVLSSLICLVIIGGYFIWQTFKESEETAFISCLASINSDLNKANGKVSFNFKETEEWILLGNDDSEDILKSVRLYDCNGKSASNLTDPWGNKITIAYKHNSNGTVFLVWTKGKDKISGNSDDLVYPIGTKTIK